MKNKVALCFILFYFQIVNCQYGQLDFTFNNNGSIRSSIGQNSSARQILFQPEGKILFLGSSDDSGISFGNSYVGISRLLENGNFDTTFGTNGFMRFSLNNASYTFFSGITPDDNGNLFLRTRYLNSSLTKMSSDFVIDTTFGTNGTILISFGTEYYSSRIEFLPDGSFLAIGNTKLTSSSPYSTVVRKYNAIGQQDMTFGLNGTRVFSLDNIPSNRYGGRLINLPDEKYAVIGTYLYTDNNNVQRENLFIKKFNADGTVVNTFGNNGTVLSSEVSISFINQIDENGTITIYGDGTTTYLNSPTVYIKKIKFDVNGNLINQPATLFFPDIPNRRIYDVILQSDQKLIIAGDYIENTPINGANSFVCRFLSDGSLDDTFANNGQFLRAFGNGNEAINKVAQAPDGKIVFAGQIISNPGTEFLMGRLTSGIDLGVVNFNQKDIVKLYPNPIENLATLNFELNETNKITLRLHDLNGRIITTFFDNEIKEKGSHTIELNIENNIKGVFLLVLSDNLGNSHSTKVIIE
ncbi:T9SS type A sorting domain-containing protein [Flavobacterium dankookense]|uniref:Putative delta-60 repeat protein/predicted secreted protein (Por secretion system target) n=1 Tax=Flavobacterium dankookense TaxID=706186 RepID=A0A4V3CRT8_9FLAO|nr:T9SS type A sorting domain-containing protein [Flavobacterium dankookense]TDP58012.1 putative delta-60 repeat protein/predicted secreted protein (Por secretion system target) [Flavobacterium dankookense]